MSYNKKIHLDLINIWILLKQDENWILPFQYHKNLNHNIENISFPDRDERKYTKGDLLEYFDFYNSTEVTHSPQFWAGCFFIKRPTQVLIFR